LVNVSRDEGGPGDRVWPVLAATETVPSPMGTERG